ncbi:hypothetical protein [Bifidobacterium thermophilum]|uniref:hypothetical protein n=1 Tax=Bifidobacterium thermophilum TaxID=33905 RepID=UPI003F915AC1
MEPFAGSGATLEARAREGMRCAAAEMDADYIRLIRERMNRDMQTGYHGRMGDDAGRVAWKIHVDMGLDARARARMRLTGESLSHLVRCGVARELDVPKAVEPIDPLVCAGRGGVGEDAPRVDHDLKIRLDGERFMRLRDEAQRRGVSMGMIARTAIEDWLDREERDQITLF